MVGSIDISTPLKVQAPHHWSKKPNRLELFMTTDHTLLPHRKYNPTYGIYAVCLHILETCKKYGNIIFIYRYFIGVCDLCDLKIIRKDVWKQYGRIM